MGLPYISHKSPYQKEIEKLMKENEELKNRINYYNLNFKSIEKFLKIF